MQEQCCIALANEASISPEHCAPGNTVFAGLANWAETVLVKSPCSGFHSRDGAGGSMTESRSSSFPNHQLKESGNLPSGGKQDQSTCHAFVSCLSLPGLMKSRSEFTNEKSMSARQEPQGSPAPAVSFFYSPHTHSRTHTLSVLVSLILSPFLSLSPPLQLFDTFLRIYFIAINIICLPLKYRSEWLIYFTGLFLLQKSRALQECVCVYVCMCWKWCFNHA